MVKSETVKIESKEVTIEDIVMMLREGAEIERGKVKTGYDQNLGEWIYKDVGVIKLCENGAETNITLEMSEMVEIVKKLAK